MNRLAMAELRHGWATWIGVLLIATVSAAAYGVGVSTIETGIRAGGEYLSGFSGAAAILLIFSAAAGIPVTGAVSRLAVDLSRTGFARWQLAGVAPAQVSRVVALQLALSGLIGGVLGVVLARLVAEPLVHAAFEDGSGGYREIPIVTGPLTATVVIPLTMLLTVLGGWRAARSAARTSPLSVLREPEAEAKRMRWWRWLLLGIVVASVAAAISTMFTGERRVILAQAPLIAPYLTLVVTAAGPLLYPAVLRAWTSMIPARASAAWYLARHQAAYHLGRSTASITPLFVGASLLGGLFTMSATFDASSRAAGGDGVTMAASQVVLILGGPIALAAVGVAVVIFMSNRTQGSEQALLRASGADDRVIVTSAVLQALIHIVTAALLTFAVLVGSAAIIAAAMSRFGPGILRLDLIGAGILMLTGLALTLSATLIPVLGRLREPVASRLAAI
ncbi:hypothetical protein ACUOFU_06640 [Microbacterium arabinogalactanolyticum]|uniref:hypothetical protein n=1 Tax=Microbacterium arabinogalactanolyticum TaxID=69365 RepID=UPI004044AE94